MHALRLGVQGVELLDTGRITLPIPEPWLSYLRAVRRGAVGLPEVLAAIDEVAAELVRLTASSSVPDRPDAEWVDGWLHRAYTAFWAQESP